MVAVTPVVAMMIATLGLLVLARIFVQRFWFAIFLSLGFGFLGGIIWMARITNSQISDWLYFGMSYLPLAFCFFHFNNLGETSIRFRMIHECVARKGTIEIQELKKDYNPQKIVDLRLNRLLAGQKIVERNGKLFPNSQFLMIMVHVIYGVKGLVFGKSD